MSDFKTIVNIIIVVIVIIALVFAAVVIYNRFSTGGGGSPGGNSDPDTPMAMGDYLGQIIYNSGGVKNLGDVLGNNLHKTGEDFGQLNVYWATNDNGEIRIPTQYPANSPSNFKINFLNVGSGTVTLTQGNVNLLCPYQGNCWGATVSGSGRGPYIVFPVDEVYCMREGGDAEALPVDGEGNGSRITISRFRACSLITCNYNYENAWADNPFPVPKIWVIRPFYNSRIGWINGNKSHHLVY